ncbi:Putative DNA-binding domain-containing protein [Sporobacter termitidis DSM 10068]|uniref:Putative DNA-binding domain-containing protein n=1 Tax=Sporobacter termitidis DSM 10068 TaxID=1123282 RepID=A0A1M5VLS0_9FIRM|nr:ATP-binding protein [Sporobacter termitidis]SHH76004.1 Putative DNA-binding domain-containing protein [Sporobacter termitidis DSM 10068]
MQINDKSLNEWTIDDIMTLIGDEQWRESSTIDYKREFKARDEGFKKDVCAFANAQGGYLFMGIDEDDGLATAVAGIENVGIDSFNLGISNALSSSIEPSRPAYESHLIPMENNKCVLIIHVFEGYDKPYRVRNEGRFWIRGNAGNEVMSYLVIEEMFLRTNAQKDKLGQMIDARLSFLKEPNNPLYIQYHGSPFLALHFMPLSSISGHEKRYPIKNYFENSDALFGLEGTEAGRLFKAAQSKINMDGLVKFSAGGGKMSHIQLFWNGIVELASNRSFSEGRGAIAAPHFRADLMCGVIPGLVSAVIGYYETIGMNEPFSTVLSIENAGGYLASVSPRLSATIDRARLRTLAVRIGEKSADAVQADIDALLDEFGYLIGINNFHAVETRSRG